MTRPIYHEDRPNVFLSRLMAAIRKSRPPLSVEQPFFNRVERVTAGIYGEVWFRTAGCQWDHRGGCTMCNYGTASVPTPDVMVDAVRQALAAFERPVDELMVSPSGSMLDPIEVPPDVRRRIYTLMAGYPASKVLIESRSEWVTDETMTELCDSQPEGRRVAVEIGLESFDPWIRHFCINKGSSTADFVRAAHLARAHKVDVYANVCLGTAFLSPVEAVEDTVATIRWALSNGATHAVVFPVHVKPYTLLDVLSQRNGYSPPSLWSLVEVLRRLGPDLLPRVEIAWYRSYYDTDAKIRRSPDTCPHCRDTVLHQLDRYRAHQSAEVVTALSTYQCACHDFWTATLGADADGLPERVETAYRTLADEFGFDGWLATHGASLIEALRTHSTQPGGT